MAVDGPVVIVGGSLAGAKAAEGVRDAGFGGPVLLVGDEPEQPYERPELSKGYLAGKTERDALAVHPPEWYREHDVELLTGIRATAIDSARQVVTLADGQERSYGALVLAMGAQPIRLTVPGADLPGVRYLRRIADSDQLRADFAARPRVVLVGGGWIGMEAAANARLAGAEVTVLDTAPQPLLKVLGTEIASVYADVHREHGVTFRLGVGVREVRGAGRVEEVVLEDGSSVPADVVLVGIGVRPDTALAEAAGLNVDDGVVTDAYLRTSNAGVFAGGDVASAELPLVGRRVRLDHWANALNQGKAAGRSAVGALEEPYNRVPYIYSDQYDVGMEYAGWFAPGEYDEVVVRGDTATREFVAFWRQGGRVLAGMNVNVWDVQEPIQALVRGRYVVDAERLADPSIPLAELVPSA
jgi:3-phenylpropionate/trans-cinnamate dioxygenase ferredoxin reductase subunit